MGFYLYSLVNCYRVLTPECPGKPRKWALLPGPKGENWPDLMTEHKNMEKESGKRFCFFLVGMGKGAIAVEKIRRKEK